MNTSRAQGHLLGRAESLGVEVGTGVHADTLVLDALNTSSVEGERLESEGVRSPVARYLGTLLASPGVPVELKEAEESLFGMLLDHEVGPQDRVEVLDGAGFSVAIR